MPKILILYLAHHTHNTGTTDKWTHTDTHEHRYSTTFTFFTSCVIHVCQRYKFYIWHATDIHMHKHMHTHLQRHQHIQIQAHPHRHTQAHMHTYTDTHTYFYTYTNTHTYTHLCTVMHVGNLKKLLLEIHF